MGCGWLKEGFSTPSLKPSFKKKDLKGLYTHQIILVSIHHYHSPLKGDNGGLKQVII
jgi:hypothetical protein